MKKTVVFLIAVMALGVVACNAQKSKSDEVIAVKWYLSGESFIIPIEFKQSNERFVGAIGGPRYMRFQTNEGYYIDISNGFNAPSAEDFGTNRSKSSTKITIAGKSFYKRPLYLYKDGEYVRIFSPDFGNIKLSVQGYAVDMNTGEVVDKNPRHLTEYIFDLGNKIFGITLEDKIPNHEELIKIFLGME